MPQVKSGDTALHCMNRVNLLLAQSKLYELNKSY